MKKVSISKKLKIIFLHSTHNCNFLVKKFKGSTNQAFIGGLS